MNYTIIYGAGIIGRTILAQLKSNNIEEKNILFTDSNVNLHGTFVENIPVISPEKISEYNYDKIVVASLMGFLEIVTALKEKYDVPEEKIDKNFVELQYYKSIGVKIKWLEDFAYIVNLKRYVGNCAEVGVFNGSFASHINRCFPDKKLYLFDTFSGFDIKDVKIEEKINDTYWNVKNMYASSVTIEQILSKMTCPDNVIFKVGFFPDTAKGLEDKFVFVNLDLDLYAPTVSGLEFFFPKMVKGGVILVHDYYTPDCSINEGKGFEGIKKAVEEFSLKYKMPYVPIGDSQSVAFINN